jgi:Holliday junction resolvase RusA-like endonuclease
MHTLVIAGDIPCKKNRQRIGKHGGIYKDPKVRDYEELVAWEVKLQRMEPIVGPFNLEAVFTINARKDIDGALTTILDCLERAGAIENDRDCIGLSCAKIATKGQEQVTVTITPA